MFEVMITGGEILDGTGAPAYRVDLAIRDGRIAVICLDFGEAAETLDAAG